MKGKLDHSFTPFSHSTALGRFRPMALALLCLVLATGAQAVTEFYVATNGLDSNPGTQAQPLATLEAARTKVRAAVRGASPAVVWLQGGDYPRTNKFSLASADTNCLYRAVPGETPRLVGASRLDPAWFTLVTSNSPVWSRLATAAKGKLWQVDLGAHGITNYGTLRERGMYDTAVAAMELFINGRPQQLARWPNAGSFATVATALNDSQFTYSGTAPARWTQAEEVWCHGYFYWLWSDSALPVANIDTATKTISLPSELYYGIRAGQPFFAFNLLEEIDTAGEYYIRRDTGMLYLWPPGGFSTAELFVSVLEAPMIHINGASNITLDGLALFAARGLLVQVESGTSNKISNCRLLGAGSHAALIDGANNGTNNGLTRCEIADSGSSGVVLWGGSRLDLTPGGNYARQCAIHDFARLTFTYQPGVSINGVGQIAEHCEIYSAPHGAIALTGNEHTVEYNHLHDICQWTSDAGAFYCGRDWGLRGNRLRYNFIHDVTTRFGGTDVNGFYLDDCASGLTLFGNVCYNIAGRALMNAGGRDNDWENNVVAQCGTFHHGDTRGTTAINNTPGDSYNLLEKIEAVNYQIPPWSDGYPALAAIPDNYSLIGPYKTPGGTVFSRNVSWQNTANYSESGSAFSYYAQMTSNLTGQDPLFLDEANLDLTLRASSPAFSLPGFQAIPFHDIGITPMTWDANPGTPGAQNGSGIWMDGGGNWWDGAPGIWNNNLPADAIIGATNGGAGCTVTLGNDIIAGSLVFGPAGGTNVGTLDLGGFSATVSQLSVQTDTASTNTLIIGAGQTFSVLGDCTIGANVSASAVTKLTATGAGTLAVIHSGGTVQIGGATNSSYANAATLDLGGLTNFTVNLGAGGTVRVGDLATTSSGSSGASKAILAANSTLTAGTVGIGDSTGAGIMETLKLGSLATTINANTINLGLTSSGRASGQVLFNTASGSLTIRGAAGGSSRAALNIVNHASTTGSAIGGSMDLAGHSASLMLSTLTIASRRAASANGDTGTLTFDTGTLNVSTVLLGQRQATNGTSAGTLTIGGGTVTIGSITLADSLTAGGTANGTLTLTGGVVTVNGTITKGSSTGLGTATVTLDGATLDLAGFAIGGANAVTFNARSGTLQNVAQINNGAAWAKTTAGTLILAGANTYSGETTVSNGTLKVNGSLAGGAVTVSSGATLGGTGTIGGAVTVQSGGTLAPGASLGTLTINSNLTLAGNLFIEVNKSASPSNDVVVVSGTLTNAGTGTLTVTNLGPALLAGDRFQLFSKPLLNGGALTIASSGVTWTNKLAVDGSIAVVSAAAQPVRATNLTIVAAGPASFRLGGRGGANQAYGVYAQTNVALPMTNWWWLGTTNADGSGLIQFLDTQATNKQRFYRFGQ